MNSIQKVMENRENKDVGAAAAVAHNPNLDLKTPSDSGGSTIPEKSEIPWLKALGILGLAHPHFREKRGTGFGQLIMKYQSGECKITQVVAELGSAITYRVQVLGSGITIMDKDVKHL